MHERPSDPAIGNRAFSTDHANQHLNNTNNFGRVRGVCLFRSDSVALNFVQANVCCPAHTVPGTLLYV